MTQRFDSALERLLAATLPAHEPEPGSALGRTPGLAELDLSQFWERFDRTAPGSLKFGLRAAVWLLSLSVPFFVGRMATLTQLSEDELDTLLNKANDSRVFVLRQMVTTLKVVACLAYFNDERVQRETREPVQLRARARMEESA